MNFVLVLFWNWVLRLSGISANVHTRARYEMRPCRPQTISPGRTASSSVSPPWGFGTAAFLCMAIVTLVIEIFSFLRWLDIISVTTLTIGTHILNRTFTLSPHVSNEVLFEDAKRMKFGYVGHWPCLLIYFPLLITKFFYYQRVEFRGRLFINLIVLNLQCLLMMLHLHLLLLSLYWKHT